MSIELKPCPFCGGSAWTEEYPVKDGLSTFSAYCERCGAETSLSYKSREKAAEAWNTRTERTCRNNSLKRGKGVFACSECGVYLDIADMDEEDMDVFYEPRFCPNCGAKVVEE